MFRSMKSSSDTDAAGAPFDIAICGAGPVGLTLALLLAKHGLPAARIALVDAKTLEHAVADPRAIALSYGSRQILEEVGAWPLAAEAIHQIHVSRRAHFGRTLIDRSEFNLPALGYVARYGTLVEALAARAVEQGIAVRRPVQVTALEESGSGVVLTCSGASAADTIHAQLAVQAEGGVFSEQAGKSVQRDYEQTAIVAQVWVSAAIAQRAYERFTEEGPLALLPQGEGYALVWCVRPARAAALLALDDAAFLAQLGEAFGTRLGRFTRCTRRAAFALGLNAQPAATPRTAAIGNAAQTLHPVAGQGLNLGLRDASVLARTMAEEATPAALERFAAQRQSDRKLTIGLTDAMARIFASAPDGALTQTLLGASLAMVDVLGPAKKMLAEHMMFGQR
jgi:2-octaprenyl-6-methoxyphenol hydroxylase